MYNKKKYFSYWTKIRSETERIMNMEFMNDPTWMQAKAIHTIFPQGYKKLDFRTAVLRCGTVSEPENRRLKIPVKTGTGIQNY